MNYLSLERDGVSLPKNHFLGHDIHKHYPFRPPPPPLRPAGGRKETQQRSGLSPVLDLSESSDLSLLSRVPTGKFKSKDVGRPSVPCPPKSPERFTRETGPDTGTLYGSGTDPTVYGP